MTDSVVRKSTTDVVAPAAQAGRDRNVERLPVSAGRRNGRVDRKRRRSFNIPMVRAKFTSVAFSYAEASSPRRVSAVRPDA